MPLVLQGEGHYVMSDIKNIEVTPEFVGLGEKVTRCQMEEYSEECVSRKLRERILSECNCSPFNLRSYYGDQVRNKSNKKHSLFCLRRSLSVLPPSWSVLRR